MNKYEHADNSAQIFGGKAKEYEDIHALIDSNKLVTPSIFGRFFLHHSDVGGPILKKVFGEKIGSKNVPVEHILIEHLLEDYNQVLTFRDHWIPALEEAKQFLPQIADWSIFTQRASTDVRIQKLKPEQLGELDDFFQLKTLLDSSWSLKGKNVTFAILGHALGGDLVTKMLGQKFHNLWTSDVVTGYLNCRFSWAERGRDPVPTLLDYEKYVPDRPWMHAPVGYGTERLDLKKIKEEIKRYEEIKESAKKLALRTFTTRHIPHRRPCNLD